MLQSDVRVKNNWYRGLLAHTCPAPCDVDKSYYDGKRGLFGFYYWVR